MKDENFGNVAFYFDGPIQICDACQDEKISITCECGVNHTITKIPDVDTPHPCGHPEHWIVKYKGGERQKVALGEDVYIYCPTIAAYHIHQSPCVIDNSHPKHKQQG